MPFLTPEIVDEIKLLCDGINLPDHFSFRGQTVTDSLKSIFHLNNAGCDYSLHCMSGYRYVTTSFLIDVDEQDVITAIRLSTNVNAGMATRPVSADNEYVDVMDGLILMYDKLHNAL